MSNIYNAIASTELIEYIESQYDISSLSVAPLKTIMDSLRFCEGSQFGDHLLNRIENLGGQKYAYNFASILRGIASKCTNGSMFDDVASELNELASKAVFVAEGLPLFRHGRKYLSPSEWQSFLNDLPTVELKAMAHLAYVHGMPSRDIFSRINELPELLKDIDPDGEVANALEHRLSLYASPALAGRAFSELNELPITIGELRTSHAINKLNSGMPPAEVAELQRCGVDTMMNRVNLTCDENNLVLN